jgi:glutaredoxin
MGKRFFYIVGRTSCPYCVKAKQLLADANMEHQFRDLENNRQLMMEYVNKYKWDTVPMIFHFSAEGSPTFLGGYSDLVHFLERDKVDS